MEQEWSDMQEIGAGGQVGKVHSAEEEAEKENHNCSAL